MADAASTSTVSGAPVAPEPATNGIGLSDSTSTTPAQKRILPSRVLPSRIRRGGPGVGSHDIDQLILDTHERAHTQAIIPPTTRFILTTDSKLVPPKMDETRPNLTKYFSQPDIVQSMKAQAEIQTPEFSLLSESDAVGGRLRVRGGAGENLIDMSEEAYIRRHRRYEAFEKKQRRREKEKLEHEHYKLRERLDQLRGLDVNAFSAPGLSTADAETRRKVMLETAEMLDKRYAVLLPPDPKRVQKRRAQSVGPTLARATTVQPDFADGPVPPTATPARRRGGTPAPSRARKELAADADAAAYSPGLAAPKSTKKTPKGKPKAKPKTQQTDSQASTPKLMIKLPGRMGVQAGDGVSDGGPPTPVLNESDAADPSFEPGPAAGTKRRASSAHPASARAPKRARTSAPSGPATGLSKYGSDFMLSSAVRPASKDVPLLLAAARRGAVPSRSRKTARNTEPFGVKLPASISKEYDFQLPDWVIHGYPEDEEDELASEDGPPQYDGDVQHGPPRDFEIEVDEDGKG